VRTPKIPPSRDASSAMKGGVKSAGSTRIAVVPFDSADKFMATLNQGPDGSRAILVKGAMAAGLDEAYIQRLRQHAVTAESEFPPFVPPDGSFPTITRESLALHPEWTALSGAVFDMSRARADLASAKPVFGARDTTLFHLHRHDTSDGTETLEDLAQGRVNESARRYLAVWLLAYATEFRYAGPYVDD